MNAVNGYNSPGRKIYFGIVSAILLLGTASTGLTAEETVDTVGEADDIRISRSLRNPVRDMEKYSKLEKSDEIFQALALDGARTAPSKAFGAGYDFWFYTADVVLFNDNDLDGHFWGIDLLFDVDTYYDVADVYAVVYLSYEGGRVVYEIAERLTVRFEPVVQPRQGRQQLSSIDSALLRPMSRQ